MPRPYVNWAKFTVKPEMTGTIQPFKQTAEDRYSKGKEPVAPASSKLRIYKLMIHGAPGTDPKEVQKAVQGAVVTIEGQTGKKVECGPAFFRTKECNPYTTDHAYGFPVEIVVPAGGEYNVVISYEKPSANQNPVDLFIEIEGEEG
ncbi:hypothetical protein [Phorcysia thermohydrogeniphila]|uniref:Uncharacterized protein n=1 Tax=Phorcysia thermohydrogeniphila TaxID=936138 RepID=A0A4R1GK34_9BACT|nr:hypothetical protein [Phorcysia thermohydrogeniphila]TCK06359.1 hypothetical protein CLV27_0160 [Phorcysia thermohydrogeniphila]